MSENTSETYISNSLYIALTSKLIKRSIRGMRYTFKDFKAEYPDDKACLKAVLENRYGDTCPRCGVIGVKFHPVTGRKGFVCSECDRHIYPLADTIFRKSETSLWNWFYAIYLFSTSKNGVSAKELERHLGVTYKTAWRMAKQIRLLMAQDADMLSGTVEADETYIGGYNRGKGRQFDNKKPVLGAVEKYGQAKAIVSDVASASGLSHSCKPMSSRTRTYILMRAVYIDGRSNSLNTGWLITQRGYMSKKAFRRILLRACGRK